MGRKRVLRLMRHAGLLAPQRARGRRKPRAHDGTIIPAAPDRLWGSDATMAYTRDDGWVWAFVAVDHFTAEAWATVAKRGDRFAATEPIYDAVRQRFGEVAPDVARGIACRHDWGPQYVLGHFQGALRWLGIEASPAFAGEPPCNGCAERFIRTLKEQCLWAKTYADLDKLRTAVRAFVECYNSRWLIERHGHRTPREAYARAHEGSCGMIRQANKLSKKPGPVQLQDGTSTGSHPVSHPRSCHCHTRPVNLSRRNSPSFVR